MEVTKERCKNCKHCIWLNGWKCEFDKWEYNYWVGHCDDYENEDNRD